jgi:Gas vesicle protein
MHGYVGTTARRQTREHDVSSRDLETYAPGRPASGPAQLPDVLERVLDKGIVIAGDIQVNLLDIELLTVKIRLLIASADKAKEMGIDWWENDAFLSRRDGQDGLEERLRRLEEAAGIEQKTPGRPEE